MITRAATSALAAFVALASTGGAAAQSVGGAAGADKRFCFDTRGTISVTWENDIFAGTDSDYTNGVRLSYVTPCNNHFLADRLARNFLEHLYPTSTRWYGVYGVGQNIYTPEDIEDPDPGPDYRPYAGFLYGTFGIIADTRAKPGHRFDTLDSFVVDLGVVGNASNAEHAQRFVHEVINDRKPVGWDDQLEDEPGVRLLFERKWRVGQDRPFGVMPFEVDALPHLGLALGNVDTSAAAGLMLRLGHDLNDDYGPPRVRPGLAGPGFFTDYGLGWYLFTGLEGRYVARDIFLEGNTFKDSASTDPFAFYTDIQAGAAVQLGPTELAFTYVLRSPQYERQSGWAQFGSVNFRSRF